MLKQNVGPTFDFSTSTCKNCDMIAKNTFKHRNLIHHEWISAYIPSNCGVVVGVDEVHVIGQPADAKDHNHKHKHLHHL